MVEHVPTVSISQLTQLSIILDRRGLGYLEALEIN